MPYMPYRKAKPKQYEILQPVPAKLKSGCPHCGAMHTELPPDAIIAVGFGAATLTRDEKLIWTESTNSDEEPITCADAERIAASDPDHDWRINYYGALSEAEYQRQDGKWILVRTGDGFA